MIQILGCELGLQRTCDEKFHTRAVLNCIQCLADVHFIGNV